MDPPPRRRAATIDTARPGAAARPQEPATRSDGASAQPVTVACRPTSKEQLEAYALQKKRERELRRTEQEAALRAERLRAAAQKSGAFPGGPPPPAASAAGAWQARPARSGSTQGSIPPQQQAVAAAGASQSSMPEGAPSTCTDSSTGDSGHGSDGRDSFGSAAAGGIDSATTGQQQQQQGPMTSEGSARFYQKPAGVPQLALSALQQEGGGGAGASGVASARGAGSNTGGALKTVRGSAAAPAAAAAAVAAAVGDEPKWSPRKQPRQPSGRVAVPALQLKAVVQQQQQQREAAPRLSARGGGPGVAPPPGSLSARNIAVAASARTAGSSLTARGAAHAAGGTLTARSSVAAAAAGYLTARGSAGMGPAHHAAELAGEDAELDSAELEARRTQQLIDWGTVLVQSAANVAAERVLLGPAAQPEGQVLAAGELPLSFGVRPPTDPAARCTAVRQQVTEAIAALEQQRQLKLDLMQARNTSEADRRLLAAEAAADLAAQGLLAHWGSQVACLARLAAASTAQQPPAVCTA